MVGKRSSFDFEEDDSHEALQRAGKALLSPPKGKDQLLRLLKVRRPAGGALAAQSGPPLVIRGTDALPGTLQDAGERLAEAEQTSESAKLAAHDLAKALGRPEFLSHKDKVGSRSGRRHAGCRGDRERGGACLQAPPPVAISQHWPRRWLLRPAAAGSAAVHRPLPVPHPAPERPRHSLHRRRAAGGQPGRAAQLPQAGGQATAAVRSPLCLHSKSKRCGLLLLPFRGVPLICRASLSC